eukprot:1186850-Prorocentrum_minimum.AAC.2
MLAESRWNVSGSAEKGGGHVAPAHLDVANVLAWSMRYSCGSLCPVGTVRSYNRTQSVEGSRCSPASHHRSQPRTQELRIRGQLDVGGRSCGGETFDNVQLWHTWNT